MICQCTPLPINDGVCIILRLFFNTQYKLPALPESERVNLLPISAHSRAAGRRPPARVPPRLPAALLPRPDAQIRPLEDTLALMPNALPAGAQAAYRALSNAWAGYTRPDPRGRGALTGIYNTNAYPARRRTARSAVRASSPRNCSDTHPPSPPATKSDHALLRPGPAHSAPSAAPRSGTTSCTGNQSLSASVGGTNTPTMLCWRRVHARNRAMGVEDPPSVALALAMRDSDSDVTRAPVWDMREKALAGGAAR